MCRFAGRPRTSSSSAGSPPCAVVSAWMSAVKKASTKEGGAAGCKSTSCHCQQARLGLGAAGEAEETPAAAGNGTRPDRGGFGSIQAHRCVVGGPPAQLTAPGAYRRRLPGWRVSCPGAPEMLGKSDLWANTEARFEIVRNGSQESLRSTQQSAKFSALDSSACGMSQDGSNNVLCSFERFLRHCTAGNNSLQGAAPFCALPAALTAHSSSDTTV